MRIAVTGGRNYNNKKIKIGYYSGDFYNHAVTHLMSEFFELYDKIGRAHV